MPRIEGAQVDGVQAVVLTLRILEYLAEHDEDVGGRLSFKAINPKFLLKYDE